eukprot:scaffold25157_cov125-Isochrysis_galbana.AAC.2
MELTSRREIGDVGLRRDPLEPRVDLEGEPHLGEGVDHAHGVGRSGVAVDERGQRAGIVDEMDDLYSPDVGGESGVGGEGREDLGLTDVL